jgi:acetylornithine deacetylase/succinyl-diaminopimelate desuccinylase-like protein
VSTGRLAAAPSIQQENPMSDPIAAGHCARALAYAQQNAPRFLEELKTLVRIPSVSTDPAAVGAMQAAAEWLAAQLRALGMANVQIMPTAKHPVVYGEYLQAGPDRPTALLYGHYDVQPAEPLELWETPPFEPTQRGDYLFGRGASDMKGQVVSSLKALESLKATGGLPINLKVLIEGEEEIGSPSLDAFIAEHTDLLACDFAINPDTGMMAADIPTITYGLRGLAYFEIRLTGASQDLHSGLYGGAIHNPAQVLCELIAGMHDAAGRVTLPGFYDAVRPMSDQERAELARLIVTDEYVIAQTGVPQLFGERGYTTMERIGGRPTLEVNGLLSGYTGEGSKTVLPAQAMAKVSMRLVPDQTPGAVHQQLLRYLEAHVPPTVKWEVVTHAGGKPSITDLNTRPVKAMAAALEAVWGKRPVYRREGGSVPVTAQMQDLLGIESVLTGFGLPDDNLHAPNERIHLPTFERGIQAMIHFYCNLAEI